MLKIINKRENYLSRSKKGSKVNSDKMQNEGLQISREDYKVDRNGYFVWKAENKKTKK